jgi:DNA-binding transcriptional LysR family regulator
MEDAALSLERTISGDDQRLEGLVRVTTVDALAAHILTGGLKPLRDAHPGIVIELITDNRSLSLARREADIAVRLGRFDAHETVVRKIGDMAFAVYASPAYLETHGQPDWVAGAPGHHIVRVQDDLLDTPDGRWFADKAARAEPALLANSREVQLQGVMAGLGLGHLPCYLASRHPDLVRLDTGPPLTREIWMGVHRDTRHAPRIMAVQEMLVAAIATNKKRLAPDFGAPAKTSTKPPRTVT